MSESCELERDIDISGMIDAERKSNPKLVLPIKEALHNSLEAIRLARNQDPTIKAKIIISFYILGGTLSKFCIFDKSTKLTGIKNLGSKKIYKLYHHEGVKSGFSEYGIGSKLENLKRKRKNSNITNFFFSGRICKEKGILFILRNFAGFPT